MIIKKWYEKMISPEYNIELSLKRNKGVMAMIKIKYIIGGYSVYYSVCNKDGLVVDCDALLYTTLYSEALDFSYSIHHRLVKSGLPVEHQQIETTLKRGM